MQFGKTFLDNFHPPTFNRPPGHKVTEICVSDYQKNEEDQAFEVQGRGQPGHRERGSLKLFSRSASCNGRVLSAFSGGKRAIGAGKNALHGK